MLREISAQIGGIYKPDYRSFTAQDRDTLLQCLHTTSTYGSLLLQFTQGSAVEPYFNHVEALLLSQNNHKQTEVSEISWCPT